MSYELDDAAAAALYSLARAPYEHVGVMYQDGGSISRTAPRSQRSRGRASGAFKIPAGSLRGLYHNHPPDSADGERLSPKDVMNAKGLGVPSYISAGDKVLSYDPATGKTEEVLAQIPIEEIRRLYLSEALKK